MAVFTIPPSVPYTGGYVTNGNKGDCPGASPRSMPFYLDWSAVSTQRPTIEVNFETGIGVLEQVNAVYVDNGRSHQGVYILFPDTGFRLTVPAFVRGVYPVLTSLRRFYVGVFDPANGTNDHTVIHALNWLPSAYEGDALIQAVSNVVLFDPVADSLNTLIGTATAWKRLRELVVQLSGLTVTVAPFQATFQLKADTVVVAQADVTLFTGELVDANQLLVLGNSDVAAMQWSYSWDVTAGTVTTNGTASGVINMYTDAAEPN